MPVWFVKATWVEDEAEASEQWQVIAATAADAVRDVSTHLRFQPHHIEARMGAPETEDEARKRGLQPGEPWRLSQR
jgi:hypothetical protein